MGTCQTSMPEPRTTLAEWTSLRRLNSRSYAGSVPPYGGPPIQTTTTSRSAIVGSMSRALAMSVNGPKNATYSVPSLL